MEFYLNQMGFKVMYRLELVGCVYIATVSLMSICIVSVGKKVDRKLRIYSAHSYNEVIFQV